MIHYETSGYTPARNASYKFNVALPNSTVNFREYIHEDRRYIEGRKGTEYVLKFYNGSPNRVETVFSVDGLSVIDGKPAGIGSHGYVVNPWQTLEVPGWRIDNGTVAKFVFRPQGDTNDMTYVEALRSEGVNVDASNQGIIGCLVFEEKVPEPTYRTLGAVRGMSLNSMYSKGGQESLSFNAATSNVSGHNSFVDSISQESVGTGFGDDKSFATVQVQFTRADNYRPARMFNIQYDTMRGLRRRGVPVDLSTPNAFPATPHLEQSGCRVPRRR